MAHFTRKACLPQAKRLKSMTTKNEQHSVKKGFTHPIHLFLCDGGAQPPCQLFTVIFFLGLQISICFFCHVVCHCFTRDTEGPYIAMLMLSTTNSRTSEMAIVGQPQPLICCINFSGHLLILQEIFESFPVYQHI